MDANWNWKDSFVLGAQVAIALITLALLGVALWSHLCLDATLFVICLIYQIYPAYQARRWWVRMHSRPCGCVGGIDASPMPHWKNHFRPGDLRD